MVSIPLEAGNSGFLSHTYSWEKLPREVLVESLHSSWVKARESALISSWFGVHGALSCCCGGFRVPLDFWQCSWGLSGVPSRKSRLLSCFIGNTELLCMQCREIGPHLAAWGKSHDFSRLAAGTWGIFSSYNGDGPSKLVFVQRHQDSSLIERDTLGFSSRLGRATGSPLEVSRDTQCPFPVATGILFLSIFKRSQASSPSEAFNSMFFWSCENDVSSPVEMRHGTRAESLE